MFLVITLPKVSCLNISCFSERKPTIQRRKAMQPQCFLCSRRCGREVGLWKEKGISNTISPQKTCLLRFGTNLSKRFHITRHFCPHSFQGSMRFQLQVGHHSKTILASFLPRIYQFLIESWSPFHGTFRINPSKHSRGFHCKLIICSPMRGTSGIIPSKDSRGFHCKMIIWSPIHGISRIIPSKDSRDFQCKLIIWSPMHALLE